MAYQNVLYTNMHHLLEKIKDFLSANGWTINLWTDDTTSRMAHASYDYTGGKRLHVQKTASDGTVMYFNFRSVTAGVVTEDYWNVTSEINDYTYPELRGIAINGSTGYNVSNDWDKQPGAIEAGSTGKSIGYCIQAIPSGSHNAYFFQNGDSVIIVAEQATGYYARMGFGNLKKFATWNYGMWCSGELATYAPGYIYNALSGTVRRGDRVAFLGYHYRGANHTGTLVGTASVYHSADSVSDWRHNGYEGSQNSDYAYYLRTEGQLPYYDPEGQPGRNMQSYAFVKTPNAFNGLSVMIPFYVFTKRANGRYSYLGHPEGIRGINMSSYSPADEFTISPDTWKVFPAHTKSEAGTTNLFGQVGIAVKKS